MMTRMTHIRRLLPAVLTLGLSACAASPALWTQSGPDETPATNTAAAMRPPPPPPPPISAYVSEVIMFGGDFCPEGTHEMEGTISEDQNLLLFSLLRPYYPVAGNQVDLPDLRGGTPVGDGHGYGLPEPTLIPHSLGSDEFYMTVDTMPEHYHYVWASDSPPDTTNPEGNWFATPTGGPPRYASGPGTEALQDHASGGGEATIGPAVDRHDNPTSWAPIANVAPTQIIRFCMVTNGVAPVRSGDADHEE